MRWSDRHRALLLVSGMAVAVSTNYTNHGPLLGAIAADFRLAAKDEGAIATAFFAGAALTMLPGGVLADRVGARRVITLGFLVTAVGNMAAGLLAPTYGALLGWRVAAGVGAGVVFGSGAAYTRGIFSARGSHLAQGLYGASFLVGSGIALIVMPALAGEPPDWRRAFVLSGAAVTVCWLAWLFLARPVHPARVEGGQRLTTLARQRNVWLLALSHVCGFGLAMVLGTWVARYLVHDFGLTLGEAGLVGSLLLATGVVARSAGGAVLERGVLPIPLIRIGLALAIGGLIVMAVAPDSLALAVAGLVTTGLGVGLPYAAIFNGAAASAPGSPASAQALVGWAALLVAIVGPPLVGVLLDLTGAFSGGYLCLAAFTSAVLVSTTALRPLGFPAGME
ncbi:MAG: MFS transporter [Chloroflexota bacterium]|nr:MFS transporter [Chloroflexota bacterium]